MGEWTRAAILQSAMVNSQHRASRDEGSRLAANPLAASPHAAEPRHSYCGLVWSGLPRTDVARVILLSLELGFSHCDGCQ